VGKRQHHSLQHCNGVKLSRKAKLGMAHLHTHRKLEKNVVTIGSKGAVAFLVGAETFHRDCENMFEKLHMKQLNPSLTQTYPAISFKSITIHRVIAQYP
jgi:hypothetical protein